MDVIAIVAFFLVPAIILSLSIEAIEYIFRRIKK